MIREDGVQIRVFPSVSDLASSKLTFLFSSRCSGDRVYLVVIGWLYVALMMSAAEATAPNGSVLGAIVTFFLYGLMPIALVVYLMATPHRKRAIRAREAAERAAEASSASGVPAAASAEPDAGGHAAGAAEAGGIAPVRKEP